MKDPLRVTTATAWWRAFRRWFGRTEWAVWLLGLPRSQQPSTEPGLILIQIDGLSETQLNRAMADGRMPFLASLLNKQNYRQHKFYSGLPASTPAVQAELYYGQRTVVPAFGFRDHRTGHLVRMFASDVAADVERRLGESRTGLLAGGSSYANIYSGGAEEVHFCATSFGWSEFFSTVNPLNLAVVMLLNVWMFGRLLALLLLEFVLAVFDFVRGIVSGREFWQELIMIPARVAVVVLLRELVTIGTCYDAARGQPIVHLNLLGYDEQAHRRGPGSRFAHWTLTGIDRSIHRVWNAAHLGAGREYDVWVFSDHGQEKTQPYQNQHGRLVQQVVAELVSDYASEPASPRLQKLTQRLPTRANWLGIGWLVSMLFGEQDHDIQTRSRWVQTVTSGPVGFVYLLDDSIRDHRHEIAQRLVRECDVPMTVVPNGDRTATVFTREGAYQLPNDTVRVFGADHPFIGEVGEDLIELAQHADSGDITLIGWTHEAESVSFVLQNGAHAGPGSEETNGFALVPNDVALPVTDRNFLRPDDLRLAALHFLGRDTEPNVRRQPPVVADGRFRLLTYNVHACVGMDGQLSPQRIARVIAQSGADIVCLQELDIGRFRSNHRDQARDIAAQLGMDFHFHHAWEVEEERFGNAILSRFPIELVRADGLHHHQADRSRRSALWGGVELGQGISLQLINTHLSIYPQEQRIQTAELVAEWIEPASLLGPVILCGDLNARMNSRTCRQLSAALHNADRFDPRRTQPTLFSPLPLSRVDHVFVDDRLGVISTEVVESRLAKIASDHLPVLCELKVITADQTAAGTSVNAAIRAS